MSLGTLNGARVLWVCRPDSRAVAYQIPEGVASLGRLAKRFKDEGMRAEMDQCIDAMRELMELMDEKGAAD